MIGNDALEAADKVFGFDSDEERELITAVLEAAAPLIVAGELERLAEDAAERSERVARRAVLEENPVEAYTLRRISRIHLGYAERTREHAERIRRSADV